MLIEFHEHETERIVRPASGGGKVVDGVVDDPEVINPTYAGFDADTETWEADDPPEGTLGLQITVTTRSVYDYTAYQLLAFTRVLTFDDRGCLYSVSAETKRVVDNLTQCPEDV
jgi:hypothetical protein